jgi:hypothetical protein
VKAFRQSGFSAIAALRLFTPRVGLIRAYTIHAMFNPLFSVHDSWQKRDASVDISISRAFSAL